jgi:hypothetical protein
MSRRGQEQFGCIVCGERGLADALVNALLFTPLGIGFGLIGVGWGRSLLLGTLLSCAVEGAQLFVPGRDPSIGDVAFNSAGAGVGVSLVRTARQWLHPTGRLAARLSLAAAAATCTAFGLTGLLLSPSFPHTAYRGQWTAKVGHMEWYRGRVLRASIGPVPTPSHRLRDSEEVRRLLLDGRTLAVQALAGPPIPALGPLFSISDEHRREIILLGPSRDDLVFRYRSLAVALRLDRPSIRLRKVMRGISPGDTITVRVENQAGRYCLAIDTVRRCELGSTVGRGWAVLYYSERFPAWLIEVLDFSWLAALVLPVGFWARRRWETAAALCLVLVSVATVPWLTVLIAASGLELLGIASGLAAGLTLGIRSRHLNRREAA